MTTTKIRENLIKEVTKLREEKKEIKEICKNVNNKLLKYSTKMNLDKTALTERLKLIYEY